MTHSPLPWKIDPRSPTAVFDADGHKVAATAQGHAFPPTELITAPKDAALIVRSVNALPELVKALEAARSGFENIRLVLINHLQEPERKAFWRAVQGRDDIDAALAKVKGSQS